MIENPNAVRRTTETLQDWHRFADDVTISSGFKLRDNASDSLAVP
jgi:hypothetical protein